MDLLDAAKAKFASIGDEYDPDIATLMCDFAMDYGKQVRREILTRMETVYAGVTCADESDLAFLNLMDELREGL